MAEREVEVVVQMAGEDVLAGRLWSHRRRDVESATFSYASEYLARGDAYELDPALPLFADARRRLVALAGLRPQSRPLAWRAAVEYDNRLPQR